MNKNKLKQIWNKILPYTFLSNFEMGMLKLIGAGITMSFRLFVSSFYNFFISITKKRIFTNIVYKLFDFSNKYDVKWKENI